MTTRAERQPDVIVPPILLSGSSTILRNEVLRMWNVTHPEEVDSWRHLDIIAERWPNDEGHVYVETADNRTVLKLTGLEACALAAGLIEGAVQATTMNRLGLPDDEQQPTSAGDTESRKVGKQPQSWHPHWCDPARCGPARHVSLVEDAGSAVDEVRVDFGISQFHDTDNALFHPEVLVTMESTAFEDMAVTAYFTPDDARQMAVRLLQYAAAADDHANDA